MALIEYGSRLTGNVHPSKYLTENGVQWADLPTEDRYRMMYAYYRSNSVYDWINEVAKKQNWKGWEAKPLRNPVFRIVEFHGTHLWPGKLPECMPMASPFKYQEELEQIWEWSNWSQQKQVAARKFAIYGDMFIKVATKAGGEATTNKDGTVTPGVSRVFLQLLDPAHVTSFTKDERGFLQSIRIDTPVETEDGKSRWYTECWDKFSVRYYLHDRGTAEPEEKLQDFSTGITLLSEIFEGMDFIPVVHAKFLDDGSDRGWPAMFASMDKIDELNRQATRLSTLLFRHNKSLWAALANNAGGNGRIPAPSFAGPDGTVPQWEDGDVIEIPGAAELVPLAPKINYEAAAESILATAHELRQDCPELIYYDLQTTANVAYETLIKWMSAAIDRANEARQNAETALVSAQMMALTIGAGVGLFTKIPEGAYEKGLLKHTFADRPILTETMGDSAIAAKAWKDVGLPLASILRLTGFSAEEIAEILKEEKEEAKRKGASLTESLLSARTSFGNGDQPGEPRDPDGGGGSQSE